MNAASVFGGGAVRKDIPLLLRVVLGITVVLVAFSRIYLGVHTSQDILVGTVAGTLVMWLTARLMQWLAAHPEKDLLIAGIGIGLALLVAIYAGVKPYPEDYDAAGKLIVDGAKMANDTFKGVGWCSAFLIGWILERRFVGFTTEIPMKTRVTRVAVGLLTYYAVSLIAVPLIKAWIPGPAGTALSCFLQILYVSFLFPLCLKVMEKTNT